MFNKSKSIAYLTILIVLFSFTFPADSFAKWRDKSDELPGMMSTETIILIGLGTAAVVGLLIMASNSNNEDTDKSDQKSVVPDSTSSSSINQRFNYSLAKTQALALSANEELNVNPFVGWQKPSKLMGHLSGKDHGAVVVGVSVRF